MPVHANCPRVHTCLFLTHANGVFTHLSVHVFMHTFKLYLVSTRYVNKESVAYATIATSEFLLATFTTFSHLKLPETVAVAHTLRPPVQTCVIVFYRCASLFYHIGCVLS